MYTRPGRRRAYGLAGARDRQILADYHVGPYTDHLRRHETEAQQAAHGSRRDREQFAAGLLSRAADTRNIRHAIEHCCSRGQAPGPNDLRPSDLDNQARWALARQLGPLIQQGIYRPGRSRKEWVDKGSGRGRRPIHIQDLQDRAVERAVLQVIRPLTEAQYLDSSYGFRSPGRSREEALATAEALSRERDRWVWITEDFRDAFEHVPTGRLVQILRRMIPADSICDFVGRLSSRPGGRGVRQGGPLSPEMLNVYLHWMLDRWWQETSPDVPLLRVADDLLILTRPDEAEHLYQTLVQRSQSIGMPLKGAYWSSVRDLASGQHADWLGYRVHRDEQALRVDIGPRSWNKLEDHLRLSWEEPIPPLAALETIRGWIRQQGAAYRRESVGEVYAELTRTAREQGLPEIPEQEEIASLWYGGYLRDWELRRREVSLRVCRDDTAADGSADQHCDFATVFCRGGVERPTDDPPQPAPIRREVSLYCDGSCLGGSRGTGGWAYLSVERETDFRRQAAGSHPRTTNNRMELTAVIQGLASLTEPSRVHVVVDSQYVSRGMTEWLSQWAHRGWRSTGRRRRRIENVDLWQRLAELLDQHEVDCQWVRGHAGHLENEYVDRLARQAAEVCSATSNGGVSPES